MSAFNPLLGGAIRIAQAVGHADPNPGPGHGIPPRVKQTIGHRDRYVCRCCGMASEECYDIMVLDAVGRNLDRMATACIFCHQCFHLDLVSAMQSGVLVWLPEVDQIALHQLARDVYTYRTSEEMGVKARRVLDHIISRREEARVRLGIGDLRTEISDLVAMLLEVDRETSATTLERLDGIRLMPLDRRILREGDLEYNQFPKILGHWKRRSRQDPSAGIDAAAARIDRYLLEVAGHHAAGIEQHAASANRAGTTTAGIGLPASFARDWVVVESERPALLEQLPRVIDGNLLVTHRTQIAAAELSWYDAGKLLCLTDESWPVQEAAVYYLTHQHRTYRLDGDRAGLHAMNESAGIRLVEQNVLAYLCFFCWFVRNVEGVFHVLDGSDDPALSGLDPATRATIRDAIRPPVLDGVDTEGRYLCSATIYYRGVLFGASFSVDSNGIVDMLDETVLAADLPVHSYEPLSHVKRQ